MHKTISPVSDPVWKRNMGEDGLNDDDARGISS